MGMAASQARFLGLTARLNNVEFEAQQINQQRTALSNKSASYYSDLLGMTVPTAPSVDAYTQTVYTFDDGALTNQITSMVATGNGTYKVSYLKTWDDDFSIVSAAPRIVTRAGLSTPLLSGYKIGADALRYLGAINSTTTSYSDPYWDSLTDEQKDKLQEVEKEYLVLLGYNASDTDKVAVRYVQNTTTNEWEPVFYHMSDLEAATYDTQGNSISNINAYTIGTKTRVDEEIGVDGCRFEQDSTGRYISITIPQSSGNITYTLTTNTITDQDAYDDAMNQYEYDKALYDRSIAEINAKIEIVQAEDKDLELRLKQLDTEHNAIQTERDQVKDLIKKNVESSFKTFG